MSRISLRSSIKGTSQPGDITSSPVDANTEALHVAIASGGAIGTGIGATTDAAVTSDANGTVTAFLRGLVKMVSDIWDSTNHMVKVSLQSTAGSAINTGNAGSADANTGSTVALAVRNFPQLFNGATWDRQRGTLPSATVGITAAGVTTTQTGTDQTNYNHRGVKVVLDMTIIGTGSVTLTIEGKDEVSGKYYTLLSGAAVVTNSTNVYTLYPGATVAANAAVSDVLPRIWRVKVTANNANATTYTVGASVLL